MFDIIHDAEKGISALIDPENGRALGPILQSAEHGVQLLETFVGGINRDPASVHPADLERLFREFIAAIADEPADQNAPVAVEAGAAAPGAGTAATPAPDAGAGAAPANPAAPGEVGGIAGDPTAGEPAAPAGGQQVNPSEQGLVADGGLPTGQEQARPAGGEQQPEAGAPSPQAGIPQAPGEPAAGGGVPPQ